MENWLSCAGTRRADLAWSVTVIVLASVGVFLAHPAAAASFDCAKVSTAVEKAICGDAELSKLDETLGKTYTQALARVENSEALKSRQRAWLRDTRNACAAAACLKAAYEARIGALAENAESLAAADIKIEITNGAQLELCREYARGLQEYNAPYRYCGVALPSGNSDFRLPKWEDLDPAENMDLVREIFYWTNASQNYLWSYKDFLKRQVYKPDIVPSMFDALWEPAKADVERLLADGRIILQRSSFDTNFDGKSESVYRMTPVLVISISSKVEQKYPGLFVMDQKCKRAGLPGDDKDYVYFVSKEESLYTYRDIRHFGLWPGMSFFYWKGRIYWLQGGGIMEPVPAPTVAEGSFGKPIICRYKHKKPD